MIADISHTNLFKNTTQGIDNVIYTDNNDDHIVIVG